MEIKQPPLLNFVLTIPTDMEALVVSSAAVFAKPILICSTIVSVQNAPCHLKFY